MLGFVRNAAKRHICLRRSSNVAATTPSTSAVPPEVSTLSFTRTTDEVRDNERTLMRKYAGELNKTEWNSLQEAAAYIEWNRYIMPIHLKRLNQIIARENLKKSELSDRQISLLIKAYGGLTGATPKHTRTAELKHVLDKIANEGIELGPHSLTALLSVKLDNGEPVKVVEELEQWESRGFEPTKDLLILLGKSYAIDGNVQGVGELMHYAKEEKMDVVSYLIISLVKALAVQGKYAEAEATIQESVTIDDRLPPQLRLSICEVAAEKKDIDIFWQQLALVSMDKIAPFTKIQRKILTALIENKLWHEVEKVRAHLSHVPMEKGQNVLQHPQFLQKMWLLTWTLLKEERIDCALVAYSLSRKTDDKQRNFLLESIHRKIAQLKMPITEAMTLAEMTVKFELETSIGKILVDAVEFMSPQRLHDVLENFPASEIETLTTTPEARLMLAKRLSHLQGLSSVDEKLAHLQQISKILFKSTQDTDRDYVEAAHKIVCGCFEADLELAKLTLDRLSTDPVIQTGFSTAIVDSYLRIRQLDSSADQKLLDFLRCGKVAQLDLYPIQYSLSKVLQDAKVNGSGTLLEVVARAITLSFPEDRRKGSHRVARLFVDLINHKRISSEIFDELVDKILATDVERRVGLYDDYLEKLGKELEEESQFAKVASLQKLNRKGQTMLRWQSSTIEQLETELSYLIEKKADAHLISDLRAMILRKITTTKPMNLPAGTRHCIEAVETKKLNKKLLDAVLRFKSAGFAYALENELVDEALGLFDPTLKHGPIAALHLAALLHSADRIQDADRIINSLKGEKKELRANHFERLGDVLTSLNSTKLNSFANYLQKSLGVEALFLRRLFTRKVLNNIKKLIDEDNLAEAFALSVSESNKCSYAIGRIELAKAAVAKGTPELLNDVFKLISKHHTKESAYLDVGYSLLYGGHKTPAEKMMMSGGKVSTLKLKFFVLDAMFNKRSDVLRAMFDIWVKDENVSKVDLNHLLANLCKLYYEEKNAEAAASLREECRQLSFPLEKATQEKFQLLQQMMPQKRESTV